MSTPRALWLAWGAVVALLAYPAGAQIIGQQSGIMGGDSGFLRPVGGAPATLTLDAMPYTRTVTCGSYTLTGTYTGNVPTWSASPSGESGSCSDSGGGAFSCVVSIAPDASGEGVETITVTNGASDTETIGFYVNGAHSCFLSQSVDGSYNSTFADLDPVATWENLGSSALDVTQGTGAAQPTFRTSIVGGQPAVSCDGGDLVTASTASDWTFVANGTSTTTEVVWMQDTASGSFYAPIGTAPLASGGRGFALAMNDSTVNEGHRTYTWNVANAITLTTSAADVMPDGAFNLAAMVIAIDVAPAAPDLIQYTNGINTASSDQTFSLSTPTTGLTICASNSSGSGVFAITGDVFRALIYDGTALDATQRAINKSVDEWALGGTFPVTP